MRLEKARDKRLDRPNATDEEKDAAQKKYEHAVSRPCELRGLCFCTRCKRCLNRDANSAPQMAAQVKRLVLGIGPLYTLTLEELRVEEEV